MNLNNNDTICAIITPPGNSTLGGVRISGADTQRIAASLFTPDKATAGISGLSRTLYKGCCKLLFVGDSLHFTGSNEIEETTSALAFSFVAPHSYTCEDVFEIFISGSPSMLQALLRIIIRRGARLAEAGEFTFRAFLNGRLSLGEAESVERIIHAQNESQRQQAISRLEGNFEKQIHIWKNELLNIAGSIETVIDFEDEDIDEDLETDLIEKLEQLAQSAEALAADSSTRHKPEESSGVRVILAGLTNSGKSSLLNAIMAEDKAIVSPERSTTRDHTEHILKLKGIEFIIEDCPGVDIEDSIIASRASIRAINRFQSSSILTLVLDGSINNYREIDELLSHIPHCRAIIVFNKADLPQQIDVSHIISILEKRVDIIRALSLSALTGENLDCLLETIYNEGVNDSSSSSGVGISAREEEELYRAAGHTRAAIAAFTDGTEIAAIELREAYEALARLGGEGYAEDILESVFSRFCIGK